MGDPMIDKLVKEREQKLGLIENLKTAADEAGRDLNEDDLSSITSAKERVAKIDAQLEVIGDNLSMSDEALERLARISPKAVKAVPQYRSLGEVVWDALHQGDENARARYGRAMTRAAEHMGTVAADTTATAGDLAGLTLDPVVGPIVDPDPGGMPLASAIGLNSIPSNTFRRPYITDAGLLTGVAAQSAQKAELASVAFSVASDSLEPTTYGGYLNLSQQLLQWTPNALGTVVGQMRKRLARVIDAAALTEMALSSGEVDLPAASDGPTTIAAIYSASAIVYAETGNLATHIAMGPLGWARLGTAVDDNGRPLLPPVAPQNSSGQMSPGSFGMGVAGLTTVVTPSISDATFWVFNGECIEGFIYNYPILEAVEPSVLGRQLAVAADVVFSRPTPTEDGAVHIYDATP